MRKLFTKTLLGLSALFAPMAYAQVQPLLGPDGLLYTQPSIAPVKTVPISATGCAQGADINTGWLYGTTTPATDAGPCLTAYLANNVTPGATLLLVQDKGQASAISGIQGPTSGGWGIVGQGPHGIAKVTVNSCTITANVATCATRPQSLVAGQAVLLSGFSDSTLNYVTNHTPYLVLASGLTSTQFTFNVTHANVTTSSGFASTLFGAGFYQISGSNTDMIRPGPQTNTDPGTYPNAPGTVTPTPSTTGGSLAAATYYYKVTATNSYGETTPSAEVSAATTGTTGSVALSWPSVIGATGYRVYRGTAAAGENVYYSTSTNSYTDTGAANTAGTVPTVNTIALPPARGGGMTISNLVLNGNRGYVNAGVCNGNSNQAACQGSTALDVFYFGINARNMQGVWVTNNLLYNISTYAIYETNSGDVHVTDNSCQQFLDDDTVGPVNGDCLHFSGPAEDVFASGNHIVSGDDGIALNANEGYGGKLQRVEITNTTYHHAQDAGRINSTSTNAAATIDGVHIRGCSGDFNNGAWIIGLPDSARTLTVPNAVNNVTIEDCDLSGPGTWGWGVIGDNVGRLVSRNNTWIGGTTAKGMWTTATNALSIADFTSDGDTCERNSTGSACIGAFDMQSGAFGTAAPTVTGKSLNVRGFHMVDIGVTPANAAAMIAINAASSFTNNCFIGNDTFKISALSNSLSQLGSVGCAGGTAAGVGPTGYTHNWLMKDGSGTTFADSGSSVANMTATAITWGTVSGFPGTAATFNGTTSKGLTAAALTGLDTANAFTLSIWVKITSFPDATTSTLFGDFSDTTTYKGHRLAVTNAGAIDFLLVNTLAATSHYIEVQGPVSAVTTNTIHMITATYDGSGTAAGTKLYMDGNPVTLVSANTVDTLAGLSMASTAPMGIGVSNAENLRYLAGTAADARIYPTALTAAQVSSLYSAGVQ